MGAVRRPGCPWTEGSDRPSPLPNGSRRHEFQSGRLATAVDGSDQDAQLVPNRRVGFVGQGTENPAEVLDRPVDRHPAQAGLQGRELPPLNADGGMERPAAPGGTAADGVAHEPERLSPDVPHQRPFRGEERVFAVRCQQHEEVPVAQILQAGLAALAPSATGPLRDGDAVAFDQLPVDDRRVLVRRDAAPDVEVVAAADVAHGQLLHESRHRGGDAPVTHVHASTGSYGGVKVGSCIGGATIPKAQTLRHLAVLKTASNLVVLKTSCSRCAQVSRPAPLSEAVFLHRSCASIVVAPANP